MPASLEQVTTRWDAFLARLRERVEALVAEHEDLAVDPQTMPEPWEPLPGAEDLHRQALAVAAKADEAWFLQVRAAFERPGAETRATLASESLKVEALRAWIRFQLENLQVRRMADEGRRLWAWLSPALPEALRCVGCGRTLSLYPAFMAQELPCSACRLVNAYRPGVAEVLGTFAVPALAREEAWELHHGLPHQPKPEPLKTVPGYGIGLARWAKRYQQG